MELNWISVKDKLPEHRQDVLFYDGQYWIGEYNHEEQVWIESVDLLTRDPSHWMPLPKPPKE